MAAVYAGSGVIANALTTADVTPVIPTHEINDILICITANRVITNTCATPSGWTLLHGPIDVTAWRTYVFWKRAVSAAETNPLCDWTATSADKYAQVHTVRGAITSGSPFAASVLSADVTDPITLTGVTTTLPNQLVIVVGLGSDNAALTLETSRTSTDPANYISRHYSTSSLGADAAGTFCDEYRATAGATGTVTLDNSSTMPAEAALVAAILNPTVAADTRPEIYKPRKSWP